MALTEVVFWILAAITGVSTVAVVTMRNVVHAALSLAGALLGSAGIFLLFGAEFVGLAQILVYVGAVMVLFLFGIMLTSARTPERLVTSPNRPLAAVVAIGVFVVLAGGILISFGGERLELQVAFPTANLANALFTQWVLPFLVLSMLLLGALIGAIALARRD